MTDAPLVSVLIPCFNAGRWIGRTLDAVLGQTWRPLEVIVVDDGSSDGSADVVEALAAREPRLRLVRQDNTGACAARNRAWAEARGTLFQFLDADDLLSPDKVARQVEALGVTADAAASCRWRPFRSEPGDLPAVEMGVFADLRPADWFARHLGGGGHIPIGGWLVPRPLAERAGPWDERLTCDQDGEWLARVVAAAQRVVFTPDPLLHYRRVEGSLSTLKTVRDVWSRMQATDTKAALAADAFAIDLARDTELADVYNDLLVAGWPFSRPYRHELRARIVRYGGPRHEVELGGRAARMLSRTIGWKLTRRLQRLRWRLRAGTASAAPPPRSRRDVEAP